MPIDVARARAETPGCREVLPRRNSGEITGSTIIP